MEHLGDLINKVSKRQGKSKVLSEADVNLLKESLKPALALVKQNKAKLINALPEEHKGAVEALEEFEKNSLQSDKAEKIELEQVTSLKNEVLAVLNKAMKKISK